MIDWHLLKKRHCYQQNSSDFMDTLYTFSHSLKDYLLTETLPVKTL